MFRTVHLSIIRSLSLYTQQCYMSYRFADSLRDVSKPVWHIPLLRVQWKTTDDEQMNCPKHVEFHSKNKFEKLVHLVVFIVRIYHDKRSPERQNLWTNLSIFSCSKHDVTKKLKEKFRLPKTYFNFITLYHKPFQCYGFWVTLSFIKLQTHININKI